MYEERKEKFSLKTFLLTVLIVILFSFFILWLFPVKNEIKESNSVIGEVSDFEEMLENNNSIIVGTDSIINSENKPNDIDKNENTGKNENNNNNNNLKEDKEDVNNNNNNNNNKRPNVVIKKESNTLVAKVSYVKENYSYKWFLDDVELVGKTKDTISIIEGGIYTVKIINNNGNVLLTKDYFYEAPKILNYKKSNKSGYKWIYVNNPEKLYEAYMADKNSTILYSATFDKNAELYFEHYRGGNIKKDYYYAIRFYNPNSKSVTLIINKSGASICQNGCSTYSSTWEKYYSGKNITNQTKFVIQPNQYLYLYLTPDSNLNDTIDNTTFKSYNNNIPSSESLISSKKWSFDGVLNMTTDSKLEVSNLIFREYSSNVDKANKIVRDVLNVSTGVYNNEPVVENSIKFYITEATPDGNLNVLYNSTSNNNAAPTSFDRWKTNITGKNTKNAYQRDLIPITQTYLTSPVIYKDGSISTGTTWQTKTNAPFGEDQHGNHAVHYYEDITIVNNSNSDKKVAFVINTAAGTVNENRNTNLVSFVTDDTHSRVVRNNYNYNGAIINPIATFKQFPYRTFVKVWQTTIPKGKSIKVNSVVLLAGMSYGTLEKMVCINYCKDAFYNKNVNLDEM